MISFDDHRKADGAIDWPAYRKACVDAGERCYRCDASIFSLRSTYSRRLCAECSKLDNDKDEVSHSNLIRCPKCRHQENVLEGDQYDLFGDGEHSVTCGQCGHEYKVSTWVSYTFKSPPLSPEEAEEPEDEDEEAEEPRDVVTTTRGSGVR